MKTALVHYWLVGMRGGEKVLEALCRLFPDADIYTHVLVPEKISPAITSHAIRTTFIGKLPFAGKLYQRYLPLMPLALEQLDLRGYDLVISSESGPAKGVLTDAATPHVCYCHSPMRYLWDMYQDYLSAANPVTRLCMRATFPSLRRWDVLSSFRVDHFAANSRAVAGRIRKHYRRDAEVIHPPVDIEAFAPPGGAYAPPGEDAPYLFLGQLVPYKRPDLAVAACSRTNRPLIVAGDGPMRKKLEQAAGPSVRFTGWQSGERVRALVRDCRALIFPGEEDFGMVPVEVMAAGRPVVALGKGGALETVKDGETGIFFQEQTVDGLVRALASFERREKDFDPATIAAHTRRFAPERFDETFMKLVAKVLGS